MGKPKDRSAQRATYSRKPWTHMITYSYIIKTGIVGDTNIGKTSLMVKYAEGDFNSEYIQTLGSHHHHQHHHRIVLLQRMISLRML